MRRLLALSCAIVLVDTVFYAAPTPLLPYFSEEFDLSKGGVQDCSPGRSGRRARGFRAGRHLASRAGVRATAVIGLATMALTSLVFGFAGEASVVVLARFAGGVGSALSWVAAFTWLVARAPEERRGEMIGLMLSAAVVGTLLGPVLGSARRS